MPNNEVNLQDFAQSPFERELARLINKYSQEDGSDTPDFILAEYLSDCLKNWNKATAAREKWRKAC